ncbi:MAG: nuclear transport factor 2 family protein [Bacteroidota bacterium]
MHKIILFTAFIMFSTQIAIAQSAVDSVKSTIMQLFDGMRAGDSTMVSEVFASEARLLTVAEQDEKTSLREAPISTFLQAVSSPREDVWNERILDYRINVDGKLATAWTPYRFYRDTTFSHCGVNAFQLYLSNDGWKIIQITDTRQVEGCD